MRLKLGQGRRRYETSTEAYDLYLHARASGTQRFPGDAEVIDLFQKVIAKDHSFAPAYGGLAAACARRSFNSARDPGRTDQLNNMREAAEKAIQLDPLLAEAHVALGAAYARNGRWEEAERSFHRALEIGPNVSSTRQLFARFLLWPLGRINEAVREMRAAERNDPLSPMAHMELADVLLSAGRFEEAAQECAKMPADAMYKNECFGRTRMCQGRTLEAIPFLATSPVHNWGYLAIAYARTADWPTKPTTEQRK